MEKGPRVIAVEGAVIGHWLGGEQDFLERGSGRKNEKGSRKITEREENRAV